MNKWYIFALLWLVAMIALLIFMLPYLNDDNAMLILIPILSISFGCASMIRKADPKAWNEA